MRATSPGAEGLNPSDPAGVSALTFVKMCMKNYASIVNGMPQKRASKITHDFPSSSLDGKTCVSLTLLSGGNAGSQPIAFTCRPLF